jgi:hypothetical protein
MVNIHVVVENPVLSKTVINKIKKLEKGLNAQLNWYLLGHESVADRKYIGVNAVLSQLWHSVQSQQTSQLQLFEAQLTTAFGEVNVTSINDRYWGKSIQQLCGPQDYVIIVRNETTALLSSATKHFISQSDSNILVIGHRAWHSSVQLVGTIDPFHEDDPQLNSDKVVWFTLQHFKQVMQSTHWQLLHVIYVPPMAINHNKEISAIHREEVMSFCKAVKCPSDNIKFLHGNPEQSLSKFARQENVDLLIVGSRKHGFIDKWMNGSTVEVLLELDDIDVLIARSKHM